MDLFCTHYFNLTRQFALIGGVWPYDLTKTKWVKVGITIFMLLSILQAQLCVLITHDVTVTVFLDVITPAICYVAGIVVYSTLIIQTKFVKKLLDRLKSDWCEMKTKEELDILKLHATRGRRYSILCITFIYLCMTSFLFSPFLPRAINFIFPTNHSRVIQNPFPMEYFLDTQKYFVPTFLHTYLGIIVGSSVLIGTYLIYMTIVLHACGMFNIISYRLEHMWDAYERRIYSVEMEMYSQKTMEYVVNCHRATVQYVQFINCCYSTSYGILFILVILILAVNLYSVYKDAPMIVRLEHGILTISTYFMVFLTVHPGQELINASADVYFRAYSGKWYLAPRKTQKLLLIVMMNCSKPCTITIKDILVMSYDSCALVVRTSMSYFMALVSLG